MPGAEHAAKLRRVKSQVGDVGTPVVSAPGAALTVGHAFDPAEAEADRVADRVLARLRTDDGEQHEHTEGRHQDVQRSSAAATDPVVGVEGGALPGELSARIDGKRGSGARLEAGVRTRMESAFGTDLGDVRVHTDSEAAALNRSVSARAFTTGKDIFFGAGEYAPETASGERTLAHELAHTQQQGGVRRIQRLWNIKDPKLSLHSAVKVRALEDRPIYFLMDQAGDEVVVKSEDQPVGLGQLVGAMQKNVGGVNNVDQRKLTNEERQQVDVAIGVAEVVGFDRSWAKRGKYLKANAGGDPSKGDEEVAFEDAQRVVADKKRNLLLMEFAQGKKAEAVAQDTVDAPDGSKISPMRGLLENPKHLREVGNMTAVDLFMGNLDRFYSGNIGNWFYNPAGNIVVIDNVDGSQLEPSVTGMKTPKQWEQSSYGGFELKKDKLRDTASEGLRQIASNAENASQDKGLWAWWTAKDEAGTKRREAAIDAVAAGLDEGKKRIVKTFSATRYTIGGKKDRAVKKAMKKEAQAASDTDADDDKLGGKIDYYEILKSRAKWLAKN